MREKIQPCVGRYTSEMKQWGKEEIVKKIRELLRLIDGDVFYALSRWPKDTEILFWKKPPGDVDVLQMMVFCVGNGRPPQIISDWIM